MKKLFATAAVAIFAGNAFAQSEVPANDTIVTDTTKTQPVEQFYIVRNDTVVTDTTKAEPAKQLFLAANDTVVTDTTKTETMQLAYVEPVDTVDTVVTDTTKNKPVPCEKKGEKTEKLIQALERKFNV